MRSLTLSLVLVAAVAGCKGLKDAQIQAYVGDSQTKVFYKNVEKSADGIPTDRRVFRTVDQATEAGYTQSNVAASDATKDE